MEPQRICLTLELQIFLRAYSTSLKKKKRRNYRAHSNFFAGCDIQSLNHKWKRIAQMSTLFILRYSIILMMNVINDVLGNKVTMGKKGFRIDIKLDNLGFNLNF